MERYNSVKLPKPFGLGKRTIGDKVLLTFAVFLTPIISLLLILYFTEINYGNYCR